MRLLLILCLALTGCATIAPTFPFPTDPAVEYSDSELGCWLAAIEWAQGDGEVYRQTTGSMWPTIHVGDYLVIREKPFADLTPPKIAQFQPSWLPPDATTWLHRIVQRRGDELITSGDANPRSDPLLVTEREARGLLVGIWRVKP